ncbi:hypothetical protein I8751_13665 [Nostocaceae cyanobacterium CENA357]|uniref:Uncharacterized protein n=1 Tax=Atlanticothrix silvestris CENA357 TaxID=1725252 RepID=A0A8J7HBY1_9CYAN|nr:DUF4326 domain-containing protein [Atlanticothrix silvestris]MBH8553403.1 hypothetical protein [Atlanticothrix silvestris CENA357]
MNILDMGLDSELWDEPTLKYVGRSKYALGLGNPWGYQNNRQARFIVNNLAESLYRYREWLMTRLVPNWISGLGFTGLNDWERDYLVKVINLATQIEKGEIDSLGCWCINVKKYLVVPDGLEKCHAEILYKACLHLIAHKQGAML